MNFIISILQYFHYNQFNIVIVNVIWFDVLSLFVIC